MIEKNLDIFNRIWPFARCMQSAQYRNYMKKYKMWSLPSRNFLVSKRNKTCQIACYIVAKATLSQAFTIS